MADLYQYLPGFSITYKDGGLVVPRPTITTDSVLVIGTATDGPKWEPVSVYRPEDAEVVFGKPYDTTTSTANGTSLILGMQEAYNAGCRDVRLCRIGGTAATAAVTGASSHQVLALSGYYPGSVYNDAAYTITLTATAGNFRITKPLSKGGSYVNVAFGGKSTASLKSGAGTEVLTLTASEWGVAGNNIQYKVTADYKFVFKENELATENEVTLTDSLTIAQLATAIGAVAGNDFVVAAAATGHETDVAKTTLATVAAYTAMTGGAVALTVKQLVDAINVAEGNNVITAAVGTGATDDEDAVTHLAAVSETHLTGGADGVSMTDTEKYHELFHAYSLLEDHMVDSVVLAGIYADVDLTVDSKATNFAEQLANFCGSISERNSQTFGTIACSPITSVTQAAIKAKITSLMARTNTYKKYDVVHIHADESTGTGTFTLTAVGDPDTGEPIYVGRYVNVLAMPELLFANPVIGRYYAPAAAAYAGYISCLRPESAPTNKIIPNARAMRYKLSPAQLNDLTSKRYVTFRERSAGVAVTDACTAALAGSDYARLSTLRITFAAVANVQDAAEPFIGEPNELPQRNALTTAIKSRLDKMKDAGALTNYRFGISATTEQKILGESYIDLELVPAFETRRIKVSVALKPTL